MKVKGSKQNSRNRKMEIKGFKQDNNRRMEMKKIEIDE